MTSLVKRCINCELSECTSIAVRRVRELRHRMHEFSRARDDGKLLEYQKLT